MKFSPFFFGGILTAGLGVFLFQTSAPAGLSEASSGRPAPVYMIQLTDDTINPVTSEYITQSIDAAEREAQGLVIKLDTPGGLLNSTRTIVKRILSSRVPVIVYVAPGGSRAGSAGVFITYAAHVAAMAPSTNIGAAHPVQMGGGRGGKKDLWDGLQEMLKKSAAEAPEDEKGETSAPAQETAPAAVEPDQEKTSSGEAPAESDEDPMSSKILEDTTAFIRALAQERGRNKEWAVKSVVESSSITETEALQLGVIDMVAADDQDLLAQLDGRTVTLNGETQTLRTKTAAVKHLPMAPRQKFLNILANPNVAYILMILGFYGLLYEVTHPGLGAPGVLGTIFLILAFFSMQTLPTNYAGVALILLGLVLFVAEAMTPGFGFWVLGGLVSMILGSLFLFDSTLPSLTVSRSLIFSFAFTTAAITVLLVRAVLRAHSRKSMTGQEAMIGVKGEVARNITPQSEGKVYVHGELWNASALEALPEGTKIVVVKIDGMLLTVQRDHPADAPRG